MTPEKKVKERIKAYLDALGPDCWYFMPLMNGYGRQGIPDIIGCYCGVPFAIEVKAEGKLKTVTPWQLREAQALQAAGAVTALTDTSNYMPELFERIKSRANKEIWKDNAI